MSLVPLSYTLVALFVLFIGWFLVGPGYGPQIQGKRTLLVMDGIGFILFFSSMALAFAVFGESPIPAIIWLLATTVLTIGFFMRDKLRGEIDEITDKSLVAEIKSAQVPLFGRLHNAGQALIDIANAYRGIHKYDHADYDDYDDNDDYDDKLLTLKK